MLFYIRIYIYIYRVLYRREEAFVLRLKKIFNVSVA